MERFTMLALTLYVLIQCLALSIATTTFPNQSADLDAEYITDNILEVSKDQWDKVNEAATMKDLHAILGIKPEDEVRVGSVDYKTSILRSAASPDRYLANPALTVCTPELTSVELSLPDIPGVVHFPKCIKVNRCGGCCVNTARACKPTFSRKVIVKVMKLTTVNKRRNANLRRRRNRGNSRRERGTDSVQHETLNVTVTEDTNCACQCRVTETDCNLLLQEYNEHTCSCNCRNRDKREKCSNDILRYWSEETCACKCRDGHSTKCSTGKTFDVDTCKCQTSTESSFDFLLRRAEDKFEEQLKKIRPIFGT